MLDNGITSVRAMLEQLPTERLDEMLNQELEREHPDADSVRMIMDILWEREKDIPLEITPKVRKAWETYQRNIALLDAEEKKSRKLRSSIIRFMSVAAMLCLLIFAIPQPAGAETFFEKLARWSDTIVEFFSPDRANDNQMEYIFTTDNPGLQQVYDAVTELGVTAPVVPMWLPEGYELVECKKHETSQKTGIVANFSDSNNGVTFKIDVYAEDVSHEYHRDETAFDTYQTYDIDHTILRNNNRWVVLWFQEEDEIECFLTLDCAENTLYEILDSIYVTEDNDETSD